MRIEFDPSNPQDVEFVQKLLNPITISTPSPVTEVDERVDVLIVEAPDASPASATQADGAEVLQQDIDPDSAPALERDKHGRVWDERIDSGNRKQTTGGEWQKRRGVTDVYRKEVIAELMAVEPTPEETFAAAQAPAAPAAPAPSEADVLTATGAIPPPPGSVEVPPPPPAPPAPAGASIEWDEVFSRTMKAMQDEKLTQEQIDAKVKEWGINGFPGLIGHSDKWGLFLTELLID